MNNQDTITNNQTITNNHPDPIGTITKQRSLERVWLLIIGPPAGGWNLFGVCSASGGLVIVSLAGILAIDG